MIDDLAQDVRSLVRQVMGMPANSVRPVNQDMPSGGQTDAFATVRLTPCDDAAFAQTYEDDGLGGTNEVSQVAKQFVCSINFYRGTGVSGDAQGVAKYSASAMDMASLFIQYLSRSVNLELMNTLGVAFVENSPARDLTALVDATWESRAQIDVTFMAINRDAVSMPTIESATVEVTVQPPDGNMQTRTVEVST